MKITLDLDNERITNWAYENGLAKVDWETECENGYNDRELQNPDSITLDCSWSGTASQPNVGYKGSVEFYNFYYIDNEGKHWPVDVDPDGIEDLLIEQWRQKNEPISTPTK